MDKQVMDWLLEGPAWLRYAVQLQLLEAKPDPLTAVRDAPVSKIVDRLKDRSHGLRALARGDVTCEHTGNAYWDLFVLADIGFTARDLGIRLEIENILGLQRADGAFVTEKNMEPDYFCVSAILMSSMTRMGYACDHRLGMYLRVILGSQRLDGGWHCGKGYAAGNEREKQESCPMGNLNVLMLLGQYEKYCHDSRFNGAIDLLLRHWERRNKRWKVDGFGTGPRFLSLQYPAVKYGILRVLDVLSLFPYATRCEGFRSMLEFVHQKARDGKYHAEAAGESYGWLDFGQTKEPSRWITFLVNRIEKRAGG